MGSVWIKQGDRVEQLVEGAGVDVDLAATHDESALVAAISESLTTKVVAWDANSNEIKNTRRDIGEQPGEFPRLIGASRRIRRTGH